MSGPLVSVVIPTFRREADAVRAVTSALQQPDVDLEVIVLDDSAENSAEPHVSGLGDARVRYERCVVPSGGIPARVRNRGLALARGTFIHFLDDDDELEANSLATLASALSKSPDSGVAVGVIHPVGNDETALQREREYFEAAARRMRRISSRADMCASLLFSVTPFVNSACMVRRSVACAVGGYAEDVPRCEDVEFYLRAIRHSNHRFIDQRVVRYQTGRPSLMHSLEDNALVVASYEVMHSRYREQHGRLEYLSLRVLARWRRATSQAN